MKILFEHANYFRFTKSKKLSKKYTNCLVTRICFEKNDAKKMNAITKEIKKIYKHLKPKSLVLFPFSHLSSKILNNKEAQKLYESIIKNLQKKNVNIVSLPFGITKGYEISIKEHKLNNIFRNF